MSIVSCETEMMSCSESWFIEICYSVAVYRLTASRRRTLTPTPRSPAADG